MGRLPFSADNYVMHSFPTDLICAVKTPLAEILGRQPTGFIDNIHKYIGAICWQPLPGNRMVGKSLSKHSGSFLKFLGISNSYPRSISVIYNNRLYFFGTHNRSQTAAARTAKITVRVLNRDVGGHLLFSGLPNCHHTYFIIVFLGKLFNYLIIALSDKSFLFFKLNPVFIHIQGIKCISLRLPLDNYRLDP